MTSPIGIPAVDPEHPMDKRWLNIVFYVIGAVCVSLALVEIPGFKPWVKALTSFGTMMFAVARWDKVLPNPLEAFRRRNTPIEIPQTPPKS